MKLGEVLGGNSVGRFAGRDEASFFAEEADQGSHVVVVRPEAADEGGVEDDVAPLPAHEGGAEEVDGLRRHAEEDLSRMTSSGRSAGDGEEATPPIGLGVGYECSQCWGRWGVAEGAAAASSDVRG